jgi:cell division protein FtsI/penicillin-binding protein 2
VNIIANRGKLIPLHIVKAVQGSRPRAADTVPRTVLSPATCRTLTGILERVVLEGTGQAARTDGYAIAGKTGTTQKIDPILKAFSNRRHTASFAGFVPADNPALSIVVVLDDPKTEEHYGGQVAAPLFREIARRTLRFLGLHPRRAPSALTARPTAGGRP